MRRQSSSRRSSRLPSRTRIPSRPMIIWALRIMLRVVKCRQAISSKKRTRKMIMPRKVRQPNPSPSRFQRTNKGLRNQTEMRMRKDRSSNKNKQMSKISSTRHHQSKMRSHRRQRVNSRQTRRSQMMMLNNNNNRPRRRTTIQMTWKTITSSLLSNRKAWKENRTSSKKRLRT